ncbi:MAG TPA: hypothetical protein VND92_04355 [Vicinamibacterales bacterium]|nr:hypothetical protein [Vicinamibacterales bacterium]
MNFVQLSITLALAWFLAASLTGSVLATALVRLTPALWRDRPVARARWLFALRMLPAALSILFVGAVFVPAFWRFEPRDTAEAAGPVLGALALVAAGLIAAAGWRGARALRHAHRQSAAWLQRATAFAVNPTLPSYLVDEGGPAMSLVGLVRPRLFVARQVVEHLSAGELDAAVAHELGHRTSRDNLKRLACICAPDLLTFTRAGADLEGEWARAAELAADMRATSSSAVRRLDLAAALVKVARLTMAPAPIGVPCSTLHDGGDIAIRVHRLAAGAPPPPPGRPRLRRSLHAALAIAAGIVLAIACSHALPAVVQAVTETLVRVIG